MKQIEMEYRAMDGACSQLYTQQRNSERSGAADEQADRCVRTTDYSKVTMDAVRYCRKRKQRVYSVNISLEHTYHTDVQCYHIKCSSMQNKYFKRRSLLIIIYFSV